MINPEKLENLKAVISTAFNNFRIRTPLDDEIIALSETGWFLNYCMTPVETQRIVNDFMNGSIRKVNQGFIEWLDDDCIKQKKKILIKLFPSAKKLINEAFLMHKKGYYHSSICLFLILSDHISKDPILNLTNISPHRGIYSLKSDAMKALKSLTDTMKKNGMNLFLPLVTENGINRPDNQNAVGLNQNINRNFILHGKNVHFGSKLNSFKTLSFLIFVMDVLNFLTSQVKRSVLSEQPKRQLGILEGKANVVFSDNFKITEEEFLGL